VAEISEKIGRLSLQFESEKNLRLRKINRMRTIQGSLAIEGNTLSQAQITAIIEGKRIIAPVRKVKEAHMRLMLGLVEQAGMYRSSGVGVMSGDQVVHMAPQADRVPQLMVNLLTWLKQTDLHSLNY